MGSAPGVIFEQRLEAVVGERPGGVKEQLDQGVGGGAGVRAGVVRLGVGDPDELAQGGEADDAALTDAGQPEQSRQGAGVDDGQLGQLLEADGHRRVPGCPRLVEPLQLAAQHPDVAAGVADQHRVRDGEGVEHRGRVVAEAALAGHGLGGEAVHRGGAGVNGHAGVHLDVQLAVANPFPADNRGDGQGDDAVAIPVGVAGVLGVEHEEGAGGEVLEQLEAGLGERHGRPPLGCPPCCPSCCRTGGWVSRCSASAATSSGFNSEEYTGGGSPSARGGG